MKTENENILQAYKVNLAEDGKSPKTIESYIGDIKGFVDYLKGHNIDFDGRLRRQEITSYRSYLLEIGYKTATINKKINSLLSFNYYLIDQKMMDEIVVSLKKDRVKVAAGSERQVETYDEKQLERLLFYISGDELSRRDKAIVITLLYTGIRVSELCEVHSE